MTTIEQAVGTGERNVRAILKVESKELELELGKKEKSGDSAGNDFYEKPLSFSSH